MANTRISNNDGMTITLTPWIDHCTQFFFPMKDFLIAFPAKSVIDSCSMLRTLEVLGSNVINSTTASMSK